jgi:outer membrane receptor protein involved in Fe transport
MRKSYRFLVAGLLGCLLTMASFAQSVTITGKVKNSSSREAVPAVSVTIKGTNIGTYTDDNGNFKITTSQKPPFTLVVTSVSYEMKEVPVSGAGEVMIELVPSTLLGTEVVVAATRTSQRILESPVSVERMGSAAIRNVATPNYYEALTNLKGVDMHTASLTFRTVTTRGFVSSGNLRFNQLIDGMDNQAPGLNFSVGNVVGITELDVDNIELLPGASSALYGAGGMNGTMLINSKNPFKYQGLSYNIKQGVMRPAAGKASPYYDWGFRYAKAFNNKFAFKLAAQFIKANDWQATDNRNVQRTNVLSKVIGGDRLTDPNYDGVNVYGDETSANIRSITGLVFQSNPAAPTLFGVPTAFALANIRDVLVSRTGYEEKDLVDYNTINAKLTAGLYYKITNNIEAQLLAFYGTGTTVYTGADRYSLRNLKIGQYKFEIKSKNWFVRAYTTQENSGDSYNATILGRFVNEAWKSSANFATPTTAAASWYPQYIGAYLGYKFNLSLSGQPANEYNAHQFARGIADQGRLLPGTPAFEAAKKSIRTIPIPRGALFLDRSDLWAAETQLNVSDALKFSDKLEVMIGGSFKRYVLNSQGTIFVDTAGRINIDEYGGYIQLKKKFLNDNITITAAGRYDKNQNFAGRFTPRVTGLFKVVKDNFIRLSYQSGYRFPSTQNQYINLNTGSAKLLGGLPLFRDLYNFTGNPVYTATSVATYRATLNPASLVKATFKEFKPESVVSYEVGYRGVIKKKILVDAYYYFSNYSDFIGTVAVAQPRSAATALADLANPLATSNFSYPETGDQDVKAQGYGISVEVQLPRKFVLSGNFASDELVDKANLPADYPTYFNAPKYRWNVALANPAVWKTIGFNVAFRWQDNVAYEGTFISGTLPYFGAVDAQITYKVPNSKGVIRVGGSNLGNFYYRTGYGSPSVGGLYYVSYGYNIF